MDTGNLFTAARAALRMSVKELSLAAGISESGVRTVESGAVNRARTKLATFFQKRGVDVDVDDRSVTFAVSPGFPEYSSVVPVARMVRGLTQRALAFRSSVSLRTINSIERGVAKPTAANVEQIMAALRADGVLLELMGGVPVRWRVALHGDDIIPKRGRSPKNAAGAGAFPVRAPVGSVDRPGMRRLKVSFNEVSPPIWREIALPETATFADVHATIQIAFGWFDEYAHEFQCGVAIGSADLYAGDSDREIRAVDERMVRLADVHALTDGFTYCYGDGGSWIADIEMQGGGDYSPHPVVLAGERAPAPEQAHAREWSEIAETLRYGLLDKETQDWLHLLGFGRVYDPDHVDLGKINASLARAGFAIESDRARDRARRAEVRRLVDSVVPPVYPRASLPAATPDGNVVVKEIEPLHINDVVLDRKHGLTTLHSKKAGRADVRSRHAGLIGLLDNCGDVKSFKTFPYAIHWASGANYGRFQPDLEVTMASGEVMLLHVAYDEEETALASVMAELTAMNMVVVSQGVLQDPMLTNTNLVYRYSSMVDPDPREVFTSALGESIMTGPLPMQRAVAGLARSGMGQPRKGLSFGTTADRVAARIMSAVNGGVVGMDFTLEFDESSLGGPELTERSCQISVLMSKWRVA